MHIVSSEDVKPGSHSGDKHKHKHKEFKDVHISDIRKRSVSLVGNILVVD